MIIVISDITEYHYKFLDNVKSFKQHGSFGGVTVTYNDDTTETFPRPYTAREVSTQELVMVANEAMKHSSKKIKECMTWGRVSKNY